MAKTARTPSGEDKAPLAAIAAYFRKPSPWLSHGSACDRRFNALAGLGGPGRPFGRNVPKRCEMNLTEKPLAPVMTSWRLNMMLERVGTLEPIGLNLSRLRLIQQAAVNTMLSFLSRPRHSAVRHRAAVVLVALAWSALGFCGEIHHVAYEGDLEKVKALLKTKPDLALNKHANGSTPLHLAALKGRKAVAELLVDTGADLNAKNNQGDSPLNMAAATGSKAVAELLLAKKADVNAPHANGKPPLQKALDAGCEEFVELLCQYSAGLQKDEAPAAAASKTYTYPKLGFQITFPASWSVTEKGRGTNENRNAPNVEATSPGGKPLMSEEEARVAGDSFLDYPSVSISVSDTKNDPIPMTLRRAVQNRLAGIKMWDEQFTNHLVFKGPTQLLLAGVPAFKTICVDDVGTKRAQNTYYDFDLDDRRYVIAIATQESDAEEFAPEINAIVNSFKFTQEEGPVSAASSAQGSDTPQSSRQKEISSFWRTVVEQLKDTDTAQLDKQLSEKPGADSKVIRASIALIFDQGKLRPVSNSDRSLEPNHYMKLDFEKDFVRRKWSIVALDNMRCSRKSFSYGDGIEIHYLYDDAFFDGLIAKSAKAYRSGTLLAEANAIRRIETVRPAQIEVREIHYDKNGKSTYTGKLTISLRIAGPVTTESATSGEKTSQVFSTWGTGKVSL